MKYVRSLTALALTFTKVQPGRLLLLALVVGGLALLGSHADTNAGHGVPGTKLWGYEAGSASRILEYDIGADVAGPSCVPAGSLNGRGIAFDPVDGNLWYTFIPADGFIHKTTPPPSCTPLPSIPFADGPGGAIQDDVAALDVDPDNSNYIWAAGYTPQPQSTYVSFLYEIDRTSGALITSCSVPGNANDTLAVAKIAGLAGSGRYLLTDAADDPNSVTPSVLHVIDAAACLSGGPVTPVMDVTLPVGGVSGIDYEAIDIDCPCAPDLVATDVHKIYDLEGYPFSTSTADMPTSSPDGLEDITMVCTCSETINLNTGYDQAMPAPHKIKPYTDPSAGAYACGRTSSPLCVLDNEWRVISDPGTYMSPYYDPLLFPFPSHLTPPPANNATGRPADVVDGSSDWPTASAYYSSSNWISINRDKYPGNQSTPRDFKYAFYFTLPPGFTSPQLTMKLNADDEIKGQTVTLNACPLIGSAGTGGFSQAPLQVSSSDPNCFKSGSIVNEIIVTVRDTAQIVTGLIVEGSVTYECPCIRPAVKDIQGLDSITFWESTFAAPTQHQFSDLSSSGQLATRLPTSGAGALGATTTANDFVGDPGAPQAESYDVFFSDWDGTRDYANGQFVTIEAVVPGHSPPCCLPSGGGLNIARVDLNFTTVSGRPTQYADFVASFVALGDNSMPGIVGYAVDSSTATDTTMGNTSAPPSAAQRLRLTVGFPCQCAKPPAGMQAWWPLDEKAGSTITDITVGNHDGLSVPAPVGSGGPAPVAGMVRGALDFPNSATFVQVSSSTKLEPGSGDFSIDAWIHPVTPNPNVPGVIQPIVDKWDPFAWITVINCPFGTAAQYFAPEGYVFYVDGGRLMFQYTDGAELSTVAGGIVPYDQWSHVAITLARTVSYVNPPTLGYRGQLYIDGLPSGPAVDAAFCNPITNVVGVRVGGTRLPEPAGQGEIALDEVEIFDRAVPQADIVAIYNALSTGKCIGDTDLAVGGIAELSVERGAPLAADSGPSVPWTPLAAVAAAALAVFSAGGWYARRRWLR